MCWYIKNKIYEYSLKFFYAKQSIYVWCTGRLVKRSITKNLIDTVTFIRITLKFE